MVQRWLLPTRPDDGAPDIREHVLSGSGKGTKVTPSQGKPFAVDWEDHPHRAQGALMARQEFRFVIDGPELTSEQRDRIGSAVQRAGLESLTHAKVDLESPIVIGTTGIKFRPEWIG